METFLYTMEWKLLYTICKFMKGVYNQHPTLPCYNNIWVINIVLAYFESLPANSELTLKCLIEKLTVLFLILSEQRKETLLAIDIDNVKIYENKLIRLPNSSIKHTNQADLYKLYYITSSMGTLNFV